ncbi:hypothetical protein LGT39_11990 [Demequina sp. TTPB684]|uniref:hypothetical protein n=1 Tax=unclassified Demequina TaxID=2620311 RepID=UPI001CF0E028|nr:MULTISPECIES: hypothetical protein [unclassified Demequina]MCB2413563.1 hypothetical protein [Demequina sp. TTPB684]UPU87217.1 hypothetical protein LGT36_007995 [Demequina sp. TMPB413]
MNRWRRASSDEGTIGILTLGFTVLALMLILVVSAATAVHMTRLRLTHLADELAEDAADAVDTGGYFDGPSSDQAALDLAHGAMTAAVQRHVDRRGVDRLEGVTLVSVEAPDQSTATVTIEVTVYPLFGVEALMPFADGITLRATGESRTF